jgi:hypothetical protein
MNIFLFQTLKFFGAPAQNSSRVPSRIYAPLSTHHRIRAPLFTHRRIRAPSSTHLRLCHHPPSTAFAAIWQRAAVAGLGTVGRMSSSVGLLVAEAMEMDVEPLQKTTLTLDFTKPKLRSTSSTLERT